MDSCEATPHKNCPYEAFRADLNKKLWTGFKYAGIGCGFLLVVTVGVLVAVNHATFFPAFGKVVDWVAKLFA